VGGWVVLSLVVLLLVGCGGLVVVGCGGLVVVGCLIGWLVVMLLVVSLLVVSLLVVGVFVAWFGWLCGRGGVKEKETE